MHVHLDAGMELAAEASEEARVLLTLRLGAARTGDLSDINAEMARVLGSLPPEHMHWVGALIAAMNGASLQQLRTASTFGKAIVADLCEQLGRTQAQVERLCGLLDLESIQQEAFLPPLDAWEDFARTGRDPAELLDLDPEELLRSLLPPRPAWMAEAACRGMSPGTFFPSKGDSPHAARRVCARCPVSDPCARYARDEGLLGVWGGTTARERRG